MAQNLTDTRSRILDTDYAMELAELVPQIMQQAVNVMMAHKFNSSIGIGYA